ncbi:hypothetical protein MIF8_81 [Erwinia phage MIF8]
MNNQFTQPKKVVAVETNKQAIARVFDIKASEVLYAKADVPLQGYKVIYDPQTQHSYALPVLGATETVVSLSNGKLTTSANVYDLAVLAVLREEWNKLNQTFNSGFTLTEANQVATDGNSLYRWAGAFPKDVPSGSSVDSTGGEDSDAWVNVSTSGTQRQLSIYQAAALYNLDPSMGAEWVAGKTSNNANWWLYNNKVYKSYTTATLNDSPDFSDFYLVSATGNYTSDNFGMGVTATNSAKLNNIASVLTESKFTFKFISDCTISLTEDFMWNFAYTVTEGVTVKLQSEDSTSRDVVLTKSQFTLHSLLLGSGINVKIDTTSKKLRNVTLTKLTLAEGYIYTSGLNRGAYLKISQCVFTNPQGTVSNLIRVGDWSNVIIEDCDGYNPSNSAVFISPTYSYTCYKVRIRNNRFLSCTLFGIAIAGAAEIGCVNDLDIKDNLIQCKSTENTRGLVLQWVSGSNITGNNISAGVVVAAGATHDVLYDGNTSLATSSIAYRKQNCSGWKFTNNKSYLMASGQYHVTAELTSSITQRGRAGKCFYNGNTYYNGTRGIAILSGINNIIGTESFITPDADNSIGRVYLANTSFGNSVEGDQRIIAPTGAVAVTNNSASSVVDGNVAISQSISGITPVVNGTVVNALHGKVYHFTVDLNNNLNNMWSACDGLSTKKAVSAWAATVPNAKLAINASPFGASGRMQDSFANGAPIPYTTVSDLTGVYAGCVIHRDGFMHCRYLPKDQLELNEFLAPQMYDYIWQSAFFNIPLVINGAISTFPHDNSANPRTAIGQTAAGLFHIVVVDGRNADSAGCTTTELANYMLAQGCVTAFNLDGGGSSTIWYNGKVLNVPSDGAERLVGQAWVFR